MRFACFCSLLGEAALCRRLWAVSRIDLDFMPVPVVALCVALSKWQTCFACSSSVLILQRKSYDDERKHTRVLASFLALSRVDLCTFNFNTKYVTHATLWVTFRVLFGLQPPPKPTMPSRPIAPAPPSTLSLPPKVPGQVTVTMESSIPQASAIPVATISGQQVFPS